VTASRKSEPTRPLFLDSPEAADHFLSSIETARVLAIDTEGASFHRYVDRIYLLQLSTDAHHAILDPLKVASPSRLGALLESRDVEVVFHDADYDLRLLHQDYGWRVTNIFDTRVAAQLLGIKAFGLAALLDSYFGVKLDKKHQRADWSMRPLTADMLDYAAQDTMHLLGLRERLRSSLEQKGRWSWAQEEFNRLEGTQWQAEEDGSSFLRLKGARDLSRRELALLRELVAWRDGVAKGLDRSTFRVVTNDVLLELSRRSPRTMEDLRSIKGIGRGILENRGARSSRRWRAGAPFPTRICRASQGAAMGARSALRRARRTAQACAGRGGGRPGLGSRCALCARSPGGGRTGQAAPHRRGARDPRVARLADRAPGAGLREVAARRAER
jgi:ribonuclease D